MKQEVLLLVLCCFVPWGCGRAGDGAGAAGSASPANPPANEQRIKKLCDQLASGKSNSRAIQELGRVVQRSPEAQKVLTDYLLFGHGPAFEAAKALGGLGASEVPGIVAALRENKADKNEELREKMLYLLGLMGSKAKPAIPFLLEQLDETTDPGLKGEIRVVLAKVGCDSPENVREIRSEIAGRTEGAKGVLWMSAMLGPGEWVNDHSISELMKWLNEPLDDSPPGLAALSLSLLGRKAEPALGTLEDVLLRIENDKRGREFNYVAFGLAICQIDPTERRPLRRVLKYVGSKEGRSDGSYAAVEIFGSTMRPELVDAMVGMLDDKDADVIKGASRVLMYVGLPACGGAPKLIRILETERSEDLRAAAAGALANLAECSDIPKIKALLKNEESADVREAIRDTINVLELN